MRQYLILCLICGLVIACSSSTLKERSRSDAVKLSDKLTRFTFTDRCGEMNTLFAQIYHDMDKNPTILDLMQFYSDEIAKDPDVGSPYFKKLQRIFECGLTPETMQGYLHGAVIAFRNQALLNVFDINTLNLKWPLARIFSPWTGKTFEKIDLEKLKSITDNFEADETIATWGSNTYTTRSVKKRVSIDFMRILGIELIDAALGEKQSHDYDVKGFFFIGKPEKSINPDNKGRRVYQFNYRWPALKTFVPDNYCIDEIVQIADGLYLGQLVYATDLKRGYDPTLDPQVYQYKNFGFWLLMDNEWHKRRVEISFDMSQ